jgi:hypothetical protein
MGLFSGSFGSGLITGLATGLDKSLKDAMDKRDEEVSVARKFWQTRQAQKMDLADAHDARAEKALGQFINEFGGDVAKGLAAYQAVGGDVDSAEGFLANLTDTRNKGLSYNIEDKLSTDGIDLTQFADLSKADALSSVRMEVKPVDIQMQDTGLLSKLGLSAGDTGKALSDGINKLIPAREREAIEGLTGATLDRSGMAIAKEYETTAQAQIGTLEQQIAINTSILLDGKDVLGNALTPLQIQERKIKQAALIAAQADKIARENPDVGQMTGARISSTYGTMLSKLQTDTAYTETAGVPSIQVAGGEILKGSDATAHWAGLVRDKEADFVASTILNPDGSFKSAAAKNEALALGLRKVVDSVQERIKQEAIEGTDETDTPTESDVEAEADAAQLAAEETRKKQKQLTDKYPTPQDMIIGMKINNTLPATKAEMEKIISKTYPTQDIEYDEEAVIEALDRAYSPGVVQ